MENGRVTQGDPALHEGDPSGIVREGIGTLRAGTEQGNTRDGGVTEARPESNAKQTGKITSRRAHARATARKHAYAGKSRGGADNMQAFAFHGSSPSGTKGELP